MSVRVPALQAAVIAAAVSGGCVKVEKFTYLDGGRSAGSDASELVAGEVRATMVDGHVVVELKDVYTMTFANAGIRMPEQLVIGTTPVFSDVPAANCISEYGVGVSYTPASVITTGLNAGLATMSSTINIDLSGGVARVSLDWGGSFAGTCSGTPYGRSIFTFFPDGRITRMDGASIDTSVPINGCQSCLVDPTWTIDTFYGFLQSVVTGLQGVAHPVGDGDNTNAGANTVCFSGPGDAFQVGLGWRFSPNRRLRQISAESLAFIGDMAILGTTTGTGIIGEERTTMLIDSGSTCAAVRNRVSSFIDDVQIDLTPGTQGGVGLSNDGVYGGETPQNTNGGLLVTASSTVIARTGGGAIPPFGIWLDLQNFPTIAGVHLTDGGAITHTIQQFGGTSEYMLWFPDGLVAGQQIMIEAQP